MAKQLNVDLRFNADTSGAKKAIADLQASLNNLMQFNQSPAFKITDEIAAANVEVSKLQVALQSALNPKTGTLDLARLQQSLQQAGSSINQVEAAFNNMGAAGQVAFQQFAATIAQAQVPTMRLNGLMGEMWTTLKNVARFQISSSIIHGLVGGLQSAFSYAQNLNESLNNIRIVTGDSSEKMAQFARDANTAAKRLSSTTLDYTNASLIYYQQGLNDQQVRERTDVTIKLANVSRQSAQEVSDQMTAIWNNFDQGSHSVEYFADVITALGATTASSSEEIATGLEKFAPIAGTIGLSYEKATSALATIVANTRQSADTVGTGLRTIFSRFESLSLGKTLEDGVDLSKYTKALKTVGVDVLDANGKLKTMDTILDDIAKAWERLDNTQKTALATTVGGVRQYTNLMALFDNWDDMQRNMATATGAEGTLQNQADIYAESWEAARNRVQTALQGLFDTLINDDAFIGMLNGIESVISGIDSFIQNIGGAKTVILGLSAAILSFANAGVADSLKNMVYNIKSLTGIGQKEVEQTKQNLISRALSQQMNGTPLQQAQFQASQNQVALQQTLNTYGKEYNSIQRELANLMIQGQSQYDNAVIKAQEEVDLAERRLRITQQTITARGRDQASNTLLEEEIERTNELAEARSRLKNATDNASTNMEQTQKNLQNLKTMSMSGTDIFAGFTSGVTSAIFAMTALSNAMKTIGDDSATMGQKISAVTMSLAMSLPMILNSVKQVKTAFQGLGANTFNQFLGGLASGKGAEATDWVNMALKNNMTHPDKMGTVNYVSRKLQITEKEAEIIVNEGLAKSNQQLTAAELEQIAASNGILPASEKTIMVKMKEALAHKLAGEAAVTSAHAAAASILIYAGIAAAIAAVVIAIYAMVQAYNADANAAKRAAEAQKALQQKSQEAQQNLTSIKEAFQGYDEAVDALEKCTKGTEEWNNALKNVNDQVLSILENHPELAAQLQTERDSNGMLRITNEREILEQAELQAQNARYAAIMGNVSAQETQYKSNETNFSRRFQYGTYSDEAGGLHEYGVQGLDKVLQGIRNGTIDAANTSTFVEQLNKLGVKLTDAVDVESFRSAVLELANSFSNLGQVTENAANAIAEAELSDKFEGAEKEIASEAYENAYQDAYKTALNRGKYSIGRTDNKGNSQALVDFWDDYSKATGTNFQLAQNAVTGSANNRYFQYLDNGETKKISVEEAAAAIAAAEALQTLGASAQEAATAFNELEQKEGTQVSVGENESFTIGENTSNILKYAVAHGGSLEGATVGEFNAIKEQIAKFEDITDEEGNVTTALQQWLNAIGLELPEQVVEQIQQSLDNLKPEDISNKLSPTVQSKFNEIFGQSIKNGLAQDMKIEELQTMASVYQDVFTKMGEGGLEQLNTLFTDIGEEGHLSAEQAEALRGVLASFDWSTAGPGAFRQALIDTGVAGLDSISGILDFADAMRKASQTGIESAQSIYKNINPLISGATEGKQYSPEEWAKFAEQGISGIEKFFSVMPDGSRILVGSAEEFYNVVNGQLRQNFEDAVDRANERVGQIEEFSSPMLGIDFYKNNRRTTAETFGDNTMITKNDSVATDTVNTMLQAIALASENGLSETLAGYQDRLNSGEGITGTQFIEIQDAFRTAMGDATTWDEFKSHLSESAQQALSEAEEALANQEWYDEATRAGLDPGEVIAYANELQRLNEDFRNNREAALAFATAVKKQEAAVKTLKSNISSWKSELQKLGPVLKNNGIGLTEEMSKAAQGAKKALSNLLDVPVDAISDEFITNSENIALMEEAANGSADAVLELGRSFAASEIAQQGFTGTTEELNTLIQNLQQDAEGNTLKIGVSLDSSGALDDLQALTQQSAMTAEQISQNLSAAGWKPTITYEDVPFTVVSSSEDGYSTVEYTDSNGLAYTRTIESSSVPQGVNSHMSLPVIDGGNTKFKGGGGGGSQGGGGGGGGGKQKKKDKPKADRGARYHEVNRKQDANKRRQSAAQNTADRTVGRTREKQLERQIKLEKESLELSKRKLKEAQNYVKEDKKALEQAMAAAKVSLKKFPITIDKDGSIKNYEEIMNELYKKEVALVEKYNAGKIDDEKYEEEKKKLDELKEAMDNYEESIDAAQEAAEAMVESINHILDLQLEKITYDVEFQIQLNEADVKLLEHLFDKIDDDVYSTASAIGILGKEMQVLLDSAKEYEDEYAEIRNEMYKEAEKWRNKSENDTELQALLQNYGLTYEEWKKLSPEQIINYLNGAGYTDKLQELQDNILELDSQIDDIVDKINEKVINAFDELYEKEQEQIEVFDHYSTVFDNLINVVDLTRSAIGDNASKALQNMLRDRNIANQGNRLSSSYKLYQQMIKDRQDYEAKLREATTKEEQKLYEDLVKSAQEKEREALEQWQEDLTTVLETIRDKAEAIIEDITNNFRNAFSDIFADEDYFNAVYDRAKDIEDSYVSDYEKLYRMSELEHQSNKLLDKLDNPKYRKEVLAFQERVNEYKKAGVQLSQSQIDAEQKWLDLIQARIALEDAQKAKQTVRLQRDNEGNWGYVYTNDSDQVEDAEAQVQKALYEYQKSLDDSNKEILDRVREFRSGLADDMEQLNQQLMDGLITDEQYNTEMERLQNLALEQEKIFASQSDWLYEHLHDTYNEMLELYKVDAAELPDTFGKTTFAKLLGYESIDDALENIVPGIQQVQTETIAAWKDMNKTQDEMLAKTGMTLETLTEDMNDWATAVTEASKANVTAVDEMATAFDDVMLDSIKAVEEEWEKWLGDLRETQSTLMDIAAQIGAFNRDIYYAGDHRGDDRTDIPTNEEIENASQNPHSDLSETSINIPEKQIRDQILDTYDNFVDVMGQALNDTTGILSGISKTDYNDFMNMILEYLKLQAQTASYGFGNLMSGTYTNNTGDTIQQEVHINANFPNVVNSSEIEQAFDNLVNKAAQFANRKRQG